MSFPDCNVSLWALRSILSAVSMGVEIPLQSLSFSEGLATVTALEPTRVRTALDKNK